MLISRESFAIVLLTSAAFAAPTLAADTVPNVVKSDAQQNTAMGSGAMGVSTSGKSNTAAGSFALDSDNAGSFNTAIGASALTALNEGNNNTAIGYEALLLNDGDNNTAVGYEALNNTSTGHQNGAFGSLALFANTTGSNNLAFGANSLKANTSGGSNVGLGIASLQKTTTGQNNLAIGTNALSNNTTGSSNLALGVSAGINTTGKNNILIGNGGVASESGVMRIGTAGTIFETYMAGIYGTSVSNSFPVMVTSSGQLGVVVSSERFKTGIESMGQASEKLDQLRPVTFRLKNDPQRKLQYGLIAEEVAKVYPALVIRDEKSGRIDGVRYDELTPLLLNELQQQRHEIAAGRQEMRDALAALKRDNEAMRAELRKLQKDDQRVAMR